MRRLLCYLIMGISFIFAVAQLNVTITSGNIMSPRNDIELGLALRSYLCRGALWDSIKYSRTPTAFKITVDAPGTVVDAKESFAHPTDMEGFDNVAFSEYLKSNQYIFTSIYYLERRFFPTAYEYIKRKLLLYDYMPNSSMAIKLPYVLNRVLSDQGKYPGLSYFAVPELNDIDELLDRAPLTIGTSLAFPFNAESENVFEEAGNWDEYYNLIMIYYALDHIFGNYVMKNWYSEEEPRANFRNIEISVDKEGYTQGVNGYEIYAAGLEHNREIIVSKMMAFFKNYNVRFKIQDKAAEGKLTLTFPGKLFEVYKKMRCEGYLFDVFCNQLSATLYNREYVHTISSKAG